MRVIKGSGSSLPGVADRRKLFFQNPAGIFPKMKNGKRLTFNETKYRFFCSEGHCSENKLQTKYIPHVSQSHRAA
jgi:hypothetical protein